MGISVTIVDIVTYNYIIMREAVPLKKNPVKRKTQLTWPLPFSFCSEDFGKT